MKPRGPARRALAESAATAFVCYILAGALESLVIRVLQPTRWEIAWISDVALAIALGVAVYLWRHLRMTREELAGHERAELVLETQLSLAADIQRRLLPVLPRATSCFECAASLRSAGRIGGDFYDFVETAPNVWAVFVGDVSGKGIPAAMALGTLRSTFRALARQGFSPAQIVTHLSGTFSEDWNGSPYVTCMVAAFDLPGGTVTYTNAGHPQGLLLRSEGISYLDIGGPPAGLLADAGFDEACLPIRDGDAWLLVTDGVTEALDRPSRLAQIVTPFIGTPLPAAELCKAVMARALEGRGPAEVQDWDDDRTVVVVRLNGEPRKALSTS